VHILSQIIQGQIYKLSLFYPKNGSLIPKTAISSQIVRPNHIFFSGKEKRRNFALQPKKGFAMEKFRILEFDGNACAFNWEEIAKNPNAPLTPRTSVSAFKTYFNNMISSTRDDGLTPVLVSFPPLDPNNYYDYVTRSYNAEGKKNILQWLGGSLEFLAEWFGMYNNEIFELGAENDVPVVDIAPEFNKRQDSLLNKDGIHPNEAGQKLIADTVKAALGNI